MQPRSGSGITKGFGSEPKHTATIFNRSMDISKKILFTHLYESNKAWKHKTISFDKFLNFKNISLRSHASSFHPLVVVSSYIQLPTSRIKKHKNTANA